MSLTASGLRHVYPLGTRVNERGHLEIGGCDAIELAREFGTPGVRRRRARTCGPARARSSTRSAARHDDFDVLFASKAFPCTAVYRALAEEGLACDVASGGELFLALRGGFDPARIYLHGNAKSEQELHEALDAGVGHIVLDSLDEFDRLERIAAERDARQEVLIRITPGVAGDTHHAISTGQADSKFGFSRRPRRRRRSRGSAEVPHLELVGLHFHIGSQLFELEPFRAAVRTIATLGDFPVYNLGGGLGVAYTAGQQPSVDRRVRRRDRDRRARRARTGQAAAVRARARARGQLDRHALHGRDRSSATSRPGWRSTAACRTTCGRCSTGRPTRRWSPTVRSRAASERCQLAGKHCESGDVIVRDVALADPAPGDVIVTPVTGAYGYSLANNYNGVPRPPVIFCSEGMARVVVRRETYEDLAAA